MFEKEAEEYASNVFNPVQEKFFITRGLVQGHIAVAFKDGAEFGYNKAKEELEKDNNRLFFEGAKRVEELEAQIEKMKCCEICTKSKDWRNRSLCVECEQSKSHINFELRR